MAAVLIPLGLAILMLAVGLETRLSAFAALGRVPGLVALALLAQVVALPLVAAGLAVVFALPAPHAVGLVLVAAAPGGVTANFVTLMARGDVALSVVLTVATSALAPLTVPLAVAVAFAVFADETVRVSLPFAPTFAAIAVTTVLPLALGAAFAHRAPATAERLRPAARKLSMAVFATIVVAAVAAQGSALIDALAEVGPAALALDLAGLVLFSILSWMMRSDRSRTAALILTAGLRNVAVALAVAVTLLGRPEIAAAATVYVFVMNVVALAIVAWNRRGLA